ncbi:MAG: HlyD family efflux transporter periplasmic adaptor subunit [Methyloprofundus sp.]|nr:HlyD family efflux transporter periplasmic adaptor subunit [Methyloprofundus sp.]
MTAQVIHEAENSRQHARYQIPARLVIDHKAYPIANWSVSGLAVKLPPEVTKSALLKGRLVFNFGDIDTVIDIELENVPGNRPDGLFGYRFIHIKRTQVAMLHHVINAYISGDLIHTGDMIEIVRRDAFTSVDKDKKVAEMSGERNQVVFRLRQILGSLAILALLLSLVAFISYTLYNRLYVLKSVAASVNGEVVIVKSPRASYFDALPAMKKGASVKRGDLLANVHLINGGTANIESPCDCTILDVHVPYKQFVDEGAPLITMIPQKGGDLFIEAKFSFEDVEQLSLNQRAEIKFVNGNMIAGTVKKIYSSETVEFKHSTPLKNIASTPVSYVNVLIIPDTKLPLELLNSVATVSIDSFKSND